MAQGLGLVLSDAVDCDVSPSLAAETGAATVEATCVLPGCISAKLGKRELAGDFNVPAEVNSRNLFREKKMEL